MRNSILTFLTPGLVLAGLLTVSCKQAMFPLTPEGISEESRIPESIESVDSVEYVVLSARDYNPELCTWNWDSLDFSQLGRMDSQDGGSIELRIDFIPYPGIRTDHEVLFEVPPDALTDVETFRVCTPDPGFAMFSLSWVGDQKECEPYTLQCPARVSFSIGGIDVEDLTSLDVKLLRYEKRERKWFPTSARVEIRGGQLVGVVETAELTRFAVGTKRE